MSVFYLLCCLLSLGSGLVSRLLCSRVFVFLGCFGCLSLLLCIAVCVWCDGCAVCPVWRAEKNRRVNLQNVPCVPAPRPHVVTTCGLGAGAVRRTVLWKIKNSFRHTRRRMLSRRRVDFRNVCGLVMSCFPYRVMPLVIEIICFDSFL